jgi:hypothetical protein
MEFWMHKSGLHYFDPRDSKFTFINTLSKNEAGFTKRQIRDAKVARSLYSKLNYPSWKVFKWIIQSNQIKDCPVTVEHIETALKIWGKNVVALKGKTTQTNPDLVASDFVKVLVELLKLHKEVYITADLFFVKKILFFLTLSYKICFMAINHLTDRTVVQIAIHGIQGDLPVLSPMWLSHYKMVHLDREFTDSKLNKTGTPCKNVALVQKSSKTSVELIFCGVSLSGAQGRYPAQ